MNNITLYSIDFVRYILERHHFPIMKIFIALENAKVAQMYASDLSKWFSMDNEVWTSEDDQNSPIKKRLPFSNRVISPL